MMQGVQWVTEPSASLVLHFLLGCIFTFVCTRLLLDRCENVGDFLMHGCSYVPMYRNPTPKKQNKTASSSVELFYRLEGAFHVLKKKGGRVESQHVSSTANFGEILHG